MNELYFEVFLEDLVGWGISGGWDIRFQKQDYDKLIIVSDLFLSVVFLFQTVTEPDLKNNRVLDELVKSLNFARYDFLLWLIPNCFCLLYVSVPLLCALFGIRECRAAYLGVKEGMQQQSLITYGQSNHNRIFFLYQTESLLLWKTRVKM